MRRNKNQEVSRTKRYIEALQGISYRDWIKLREGIDGAFAKEKGEFEKTLKFANPEDAERVSVHDLDVNWIDAPIISIIENVDIIQAIQTVKLLFGRIARSINRSAFFPPD